MSTVRRTLQFLWRYSIFQLIGFVAAHHVTALVSLTSLALPGRRQRKTFEEIYLPIRTGESWNGGETCLSAVWTATNSVKCSWCVYGLFCCPQVAAAAPRPTCLKCTADIKFSNKHISDKVKYSICSYQNVHRWLQKNDQILLFVHLSLFRCEYIC